MRFELNSEPLEKGFESRTLSVHRNRSLTQKYLFFMVSLRASPFKN
jgi:hypothetical protein